MPERKALLRLGSSHKNPSISRLTIVSRLELELYGGAVAERLRGWKEYHMHSKRMGKPGSSGVDLATRGLAILREQSFLSVCEWQVF